MTLSLDPSSLLDSLGREPLDAFQRGVIDIIMRVSGALDGCQNFSASSRLLRVGGQIPAATDPEARYHHNASYLAGVVREVQDVRAVTGAVHRSISTETCHALLELRADLGDAHHDAPLRPPDPLPVRAGAQARYLLNVIGRLAVYPRDTTFERTTLGGRPCERIVVAGADQRRAVLYLHGGAYIVGGAGTHRALAAHLAAACGAAVHLLDYRLAPEAPYPAAVEDTLAAYRELRGTAGSVTVAGDSAGGGLTLG